MGNCSGKLSLCIINRRNIRRESRGDETGIQHHNDRLPANTVDDENIYVTERCNSNTIDSSQQESENVSSVILSSISTSNLSEREVPQHIIRESANTISIMNSNNPHIDGSINCYGPVSIVSSNQSNVQIINQQCAPIVHDFDIGTASTDQLRIVCRDKWFARQPKNQLDRLTLPNTVTIAHTVYSDTRMPNFNIVRNIQDFHMRTRQWDDVGYNFIIGRDGTVFVGRGWLYKGEHHPDYSNSICIAFIGNFNDETPSDESLLAAKRLIERGVDIGKLDENYRVCGHCQLFLTESPGKKLYEIIQTWDHWTYEVQPPI